MKRDFYISYTSADVQWAKWISATLEKNGYSVFLLAWDINPGDNWRSKMERALRACECFICVLSPRFLNSKSARDELNEALSSHKKILPMRVEDFKVSGLLESIAYIDLVGRDETEARMVLLNSVEEKNRASKKPQLPSSIDFVSKIVFPKSVLISNLPPRSNYFIGNDEQIEFIANAFKNSNHVVIGQTISGLGGIGKTQLAIEFAYRYASNYQTAIWLVNAESSASVYNEFIKFSSDLKIQQSENWTEDELGEVTRNWMQANTNWLIIFNNLVSDTTIEKYVPESLLGGHILITTRNTQMISGFNIDLSVFSPNEAVAFLHKRLGDKYSSDADAHSLAQQLGCLPLALEQAAAYILINKININDYSKLLDRNGLSIFDDAAKPTDYSNIVSKTLYSSITHLSDEAQQLISICAYMAPDNIPIRLFQDSREILPEPLKTNAEQRFSNILVELRNSSLINGDEGHINIHRMTQVLIRQNHFENTQWLDYCFAAIQTVIPHDFSTFESRTWFECLATHVDSILRFSMDQYIENDEKQRQIADLYHKSGCGNEHLGNYPKALECYYKALAIREKFLGNEHPDTASTYNDIAVVYSSQGDYSKALEWYYRALAVREKMLGKEHPDTAATYNNIAIVYTNQGNYSKALECSQKALASWKRILGKEHPDTAATYNNIAAVYRDQGDYPKALEWYHKALAICEKVLGREHPDTATTYNNIAYVYDSQGDYQKALEWCQKALTIREKVLGKEHPDTATVYCNIAMVFYGMGDYDKSLAFYAEALHIYFDTLGESHPSLQKTYALARTAYTAANHRIPFEKWLQEAFTHGGDLQ